MWIWVFLCFHAIATMLTWVLRENIHQSADHLQWGKAKTVLVAAVNKTLLRCKLSSCRYVWKENAVKDKKNPTENKTWVWVICDAFSIRNRACLYGNVMWFTEYEIFPVQFGLESKVRGSLMTSWPCWIFLDVTAIEIRILCSHCACCWQHYDSQYDEGG